MRGINLFLFMSVFSYGFLNISTGKTTSKLAKGMSEAFPKTESLQEKDGWELQKDEDDIQIYSRTYPGTNLKQRKGTAIINSTISGVVTLIKDTEAGPLWIDRMIDFRNLKIINDKEWYTYSELEIPWPFDNRDLITKNIITQNKETKTVTITLISVPDYIKTKEGKVRMGASEGSWTIEPLGENRVRVTYLMWSEPGKFIFPQAFITPIVVNSIHSTIQKMKGLLEKEKYRNANLPYLM